MTRHCVPADDSDALCVVVPKFLKGGLREVAKRIGDSVSSVVRSALLEYLIKQRKNSDEVR